MSAYEGDAAAIGKLIWNWGEAYVISYANGHYHAERRDNGAQVHAPDPEVGHVAGFGLTVLMASGSCLAPEDRKGVPDQDPKPLLTCQAMVGTAGFEPATP